MKLLHSMLLGVIGLVPVTGEIYAETTLFDAQIEKAGVRFGCQRPFSVYYPYSYSCFTPCWGSRSRACHWLYTNGSYVYTCH